LVSKYFAYSFKDLKILYKQILVQVKACFVNFTIFIQRVLAYCFFMHEIPLSC
jgi:hypothetical protein